MDFQRTIYRCTIHRQRTALDAGSKAFRHRVHGVPIVVQVRAADELHLSAPLRDGAGNARVK
jgi:hypothetical protein